MNTPRVGRRGSQRRTTKVSKIPQAIISEPAPLEDVLVTNRLRSRRRRKPHAYQENLAWRTLAKAMADSPDNDRCAASYRFGLVLWRKRGPEHARNASWGRTGFSVDPSGRGFK